MDPYFPILVEIFVLGRVNGFKVHADGLRQRAEFAQLLTHLLERGLHVGLSTPHEPG